MGTPPQRKKEIRQLVLKAVYDEADGDTNVMVELYDLTRKLGLTDDEMDSAVRYWKNQLCLEGGDSYVSLTGLGVDEREQSEDPEPLNERFMQRDIINVHITNSSIGNQQIGGQENVATVNNTAITDAIQRLRDAVDELPPEKQAEATPLINELAMHAKDPKAHAIARSRLATIATIVGPALGPFITAIASLIAG